MYVCVCACVYECAGACGGQKRASNILESEFWAVINSLREFLWSTGPLKEQQGLLIGSHPSHLSCFSFNTITTWGKPRNKMLVLSVANFFQFYYFES